MTGRRAQGAGRRANQARRRALAKVLLRPAPRALRPE
jgi:hypothetical protein